MDRELRLYKFMREERHFMYVYISIYIHIMTLFPHLFLQPGCFFLLVVSTDQPLRMVLSSWRKILKPRRWSMTLAVPSCWVQLRCEKKRDFLVSRRQLLLVGYRKKLGQTFGRGIFPGAVFWIGGKKVCFEVKPAGFATRNWSPITLEGNNFSNLLKRCLFYPQNLSSGKMCPVI